MAFDYDVKSIDIELEKYLPKAEGLQKKVYHAMREAIAAGGKRIRPIFIWESYKVFESEKPDINKVLSYMAAIEMIHTASLIHDDLPCIDNDKLRRGKATTWVTYGEDMAVLTGDAFFIEAFDVIASDMLSKFESEMSSLPYIKAMLRANRILANRSGMQGMIGGEVIDVEFTGKTVEKKVLKAIYELKTSALIEASMLIGAVLGMAGNGELAIVEEAAKCVGMAFQIRDDILDATSSTKVLGKTVGSDEKNNKTNYVSLYGLEKAKKECYRLSKEAKDLLLSLDRDTTTLRKIIEGLIDRES